MYPLKLILGRIFSILLLFLLYGQPNAMAQSSIVDTKAPYLLVKISVPNEKTLCLLWDVNKNQYADIKNDVGTPAVFPCDLNEISNWTNNSSRVTRNLFSPTLCGYEGMDRVSVPGACIGVPCIFEPGSCDNVYTDETNCWDESGNSPLTNTYLFHKECSAPFIEGEGLSYREIILENTFPAFNGGLLNNYPNTYPKAYTWSFRNKIQGKSAYRTQYYAKITNARWLWKGTDNIVTDQYNDNEQGEFKIFTPLGILAGWNYNLINTSYYFNPAGTSCPSEETIEWFTDSKQNIGGIYCDNAMAQIFTIESLGIRQHRPCATAHGGYLSSDCKITNLRCNADHEEYVKFSEFKVLGSATYTVDAEYTDAKTLQRNSAFEAAIVDLKTKLESSVAPPPIGKLTNYSIEMEFRKIPCPIDVIVVDKKPLLPGKPAKATAYDSDSKAVSPVIWTLKPKSGDAFAVIDKDTGVITDVAGNGTVTIRAENPENPDCSKEIEVEVGCEKCSADNKCEFPGAGEPDLHSIELKLSLGKGQESQHSGALYLRAKNPDPSNSTPGILELLRYGNEAKAVYDHSALRQITAPETFVDIVLLNEYSYSINFYKPEARGNVVNGFYEIKPSFTPMVSWVIENPDASPENYNRLKISEVKEGAVKTYEYLWDAGEQIWSLNKNNGLQIIQKKQELNGNLLVETETISDNTGIIASKKITTYKTVIYSGTTREVLIQEIIDPDGTALTTTNTYYEEPNCLAGSCGKLKNIVNPDGSWARYEYDNKGRVILEVRPWLDVPSGAPIDNARAIYYDYTPQDSSDSNKPEDIFFTRKIIEKIQGIPVALTYYVYQVNIDGERTEIVEQAASPTAAYGAAGNPRTITVTNPFNASLPGSLKIKSSTYPDGRLDTYTYEYGTYTPNGTQAGTFTKNITGIDLRTMVTHGTINSPSGITGKTTREINITNSFGRELYRETQTYNYGYETQNWQVTLYDSNNRVSDVYNSDGTHQQTTWGCCNLEAETNAQGIQTLYASYDSLGRLLTKIKKGTATIPDIYYTYTYDAAGRRLSETVSSNGLSLSTGQTYDLAGRIKTSTDSTGLSTNYLYEQGGRVSSVVRPGGFTEITNRFIDGRVKSLIGTGVIPKYYEYTVNVDGTQSVKVYTGSATSPNWEKTSTDILGRTLSQEKPGYAGTEITGHFYDNLGRLVKVSQPGSADSLYEYDEVGNVIWSGLDANNDGMLDFSSDVHVIYNINEIYGPYQETSQYAFSVDENDTLSVIQTNKQSTQLNEFGDGGLVHETISMDSYDNQTISQTYLDRANKTLTQIVDYPDSTINAETVTINGLVMSQKSKSGNITGFEYDSLGRRTGTIDLRIGKSIAHYNARNQVDYIQDAAGNITTYTYDPQTGRKISETNSLNKTTYYSYNNLGQITRTWGAAEPVEYVYDNYARLSELHTFRQGNNWQSATWPTGNTGPADVTKWHYQESTGLLLSKEYPDGKTVCYTYEVDGRLKTRTWARANQGNPLTTTYSYDTGTGDLLNIDYSDNTPDVTFTYDGLGRQKTVTDYVGTRTFRYQQNFPQLEEENITGLYNKTITKTYEGSNPPLGEGFANETGTDDEINSVPGRSTGFTLGSDYSLTYGYEAETGRFNSVAWNAAGKTGSAAYSYLPNSDLIFQLAHSPQALITYSYDPNRNLKTQVKNQYGTAVISRYDYQYDALGRRTNMTTTGTAPWGTPDLQSGTSNYVSNSLNQYTQVTSSILNQQSGILNLSYDSDGNLIQSAEGTIGTKYSYDAENRLIAVEPQIPTSCTTKVEFAYDYMGRRVEKKVFSYVAGDWQLMTDSLFLHDGWNLISESSVTGQETPVVKYYVWGLDLSQSLQGAGGVGGLIASVDTNTNKMYYYFYDANGNVGQLIDAADGSLTAHYEYDPYGNLLIKSGSYADANPYRFSSKYFDNETGLGYWGYRYYAPNLGRWISRDPIEEDDDLNLYAFVNNDSINAIDLLGNKTLIDYLEERMLYFYNNHSGQVGTRCPIQLGLDQTNCIIYCSSVIEWAYAQIGNKEIAKTIAQKSKKGTELAKYLESIGWKGIYWNPDVNNPFDEDKEHSYTYKIAKQKKKYYDIGVSDYAINYRPTQIYINNPPWWKIWEPKELDYEKMTKKDLTGLTKLMGVRFGFGVARGGKHTFLYGTGNIYEVHWGGVSVIGLYEKSLFQNYGWLSGILMVPPGNGVF